MWKGIAIALLPIALAMMNHYFRHKERADENKEHQKRQERRREQRDEEITYDHQYPEDDHD